MSDVAQGPDWWVAADGKWYPPADESPGEGWWLAADGKWYPPADESPGEGWWLAADGKWYPPVDGDADASAAPAAAGSAPAAPPAPAKPAPAPAKPAPVAAKPVPPKSALAKPVPAKPVPAKPVAAKPVPAKPVPAKPVPAKPVPAKPVAAKPVPAKAAAKKAVPATPGKAAPAASTKAPAKAAPPKSPRSLNTAAQAPATGEDPVNVRNQQSAQDARMLAAKRMQAASRALASLGELDEAPTRELRSTRAVREPAPASTPAAATPAPSPAAPSAPKPAAAQPAPTQPAPAQPKPAQPAAASPAQPAAVAPTRPSTSSSRSHNAPVASLITTAVPDRPRLDRPPPVQAPPATGSAVIAPPTPRPTTQMAALDADLAPLLEVKPDRLKTDVDRIGDRLVVFKDRVELHDKSGVVRQSIRGDQITDVVVQKKFTGSAVTVESIDGTMIVAKGLRPEQAEEVRDLILRRTRRGDNPPHPRPSAPTSPRPSVGAAAPVTSSGPAIDAADLLAKLDDLHAAGVLSTAELDDKRAVVARLAERSPVATS